MAKRSLHHRFLRRGSVSSPAWFYVLVGIGATLTVVVLAVLVDSAVHYNRIHAGVSVAGVDLGGKTRDEAVTSLNGLVETARSVPISVTANGKSWTLTPDEAGTSIDVEGAVAAALAVTRENHLLTDIGTRWRLYFSKEDVPLRGSVDSARVASFVSGIARAVDIAPVNASLAIENGSVKVIESVDGKVVDQVKLDAQLAALLVSLRSDPLQVPMVVKQPDVTAEDNAQAQSQAETMISAPVMLTAGSKKWTVIPEEIASYMGFRSEERNGVSTLVPFMDASKLQPLFGQIAPAVAQKSTNASFAHNATRAWVVAAKNGKQLDAEATAAALTKATLKKTGRTAKAVTKVKEPDRTTDEAKAMGIKTLLSSYKTTYACDSDRQTNVKMATKYACGVLLAPGEEYDFDKQVGRRTAARGFKLAPGIVRPGELEDVLGGGICQVSTTMFNAVASGKAGLKITERHNHSLFISHYPKGRDATVTGGGKNLRFVNDTSHYIWITGSSTGVTTTISVWGTDEGRSTKWTVGEFYNVKPMTKTSVTDKNLKAGQTSLLQNGQPGRYLKTTRVVSRNGKVVHKNVWTNVFPMVPEEIAVGTGTTKPPTTPTTKPPTTVTTKATTTSSTTTTTAGPG